MAKSSFVNSIQRHAYHFKNSRLGHDLPTSVNDSDFAILKGFIFVNSKKKPPTFVANKKQRFKPACVSLPLLLAVQNLNIPISLCR